MTDDRLQRLAPLVGRWTVEAPAFDGTSACSFEWTLGGRYLLQRTEPFAVPGAPEALALIAPDGDGYLQHYFDSRGVVRLYRMTFDGREWMLTRDEPDFSELSFRQRFVGVFEDADTIRGRWEKTGDTGALELDFELIYRREG